MSKSNLSDNYHFNHMDTKLCNMDPDEFVAFIEECEKKAAELEITVDYYIAEFT